MQAEFRRERGLEQHLRAWVRQHELALIRGWLAAAALVLVFLALWGVLLGGADRVVDAWNARWPAKIDRCADLMARGDLLAAAQRLERLDARFPAVSVKHRLDQQRERLLGLLAQSYQELGRKRVCLETHQRRIDFDPRNWRNHFDQANALVHFTELAAGLDAFARVTRIHPTHLPTLQEVVRLHFEAARFEEVVLAYEAYLEAWLLAPITLRFGEHSQEVEVPCDGRRHEIDVPLALAQGWSGSFCIESRGYSLRFHSAELTAPVLAGEESALDSRRVSADRTFELEGMAEVDRGLGEEDRCLFAAQGNTSRLCTGARAPATGSARLLIELTGYKALDAATWAMVEKSYGNLLAWERLAEARRRTCVGGTLQAGSIFD
jgi:tetratricopeptide (TPR) repeat protein